MCDKGSTFWSCALLSLALLVSLQAADKQGSKTAVPPQLVWHDPAGAQDRGQAGGPANKPAPPFKFVEEDFGGTNPKVKIRDGRGRLWIVKWGPEVQAESFAAQFVRSAGYFTRPIYFVEKGNIADAQDLKRAKPHIARDGAFQDAAFKLISEDTPYLQGHNWAWTDNPFLATPDGRRQLNGLKVLVMLLSNWDAKDTRDFRDGINTAIYSSTAKGRTVRYLYGVDDWGAAMGRWGNVFTREKWDCEGYAKQTPEFVTGVKDGFVEWGFTGRRAEDIAADISVEDIRWVLRSLGRISDGQLRQQLKASGATAEETDCFRRAIQERIRQLQEVTATKARPVRAVAER